MVASRLVTLEPKTRHGGLLSPTQRGAPGAFRRLKPYCEKSANCMLNGSIWFVCDSHDLFESSPTDPKLSDADGTDIFGGSQP